MTNKTPADLQEAVDAAILHAFAQEYPKPSEVDSFPGHTFAEQFAREAIKYFIARHAAPAERQAAGEGVEPIKYDVSAWVKRVKAQFHEEMDGFGDDVTPKEEVAIEWAVEFILEQRLPLYPPPSETRTQGAAVDVPGTFSFDRYKDGRLMAEGVTVTGESLEHATKKAVNLCKHDTPYCVLVYRDHLPAPSSEKGKYVPRECPSCKKKGCECVTMSDEQKGGSE